MKVTKPDQPNSICLYFYPGTRATRAQWMLEELNISYELNVIDLHQGAQKSDEYLAIHPLGKVPVLKIGDLIVFESLAICLYLADSYPTYALAPKFTSADRAVYYQWMAFSIGTLEPAIIEQSRSRKAVEQETDYIDMGPVLTPFNNAMAYINDTLANSPFLLGKNFTAADIMIGSIVNWANNMTLLANFKHAQTWLEQLKQRPAYQRIKED